MARYREMFETRRVIRMPRATVFALLSLTAGISALSGCDEEGSNGDVIVAPPPTSSVSPAPTVLAATCEGFAGTSIDPAMIGLPTGGASVIAAETVPASGTGPATVVEHCIVSGRIRPVDASAPEIRFQVALPRTWNNKVVMLGGGGFNGTIPPVAGNVLNTAPTAMTPLARGYAVFASDSGHQDTGEEPGRFLLNEEALKNYYGDAIKKTRDASFAVVRAAYGRAPFKSYFLGGSTGGREGLQAVGRWPDDWDGVVSLYPARNNVAQILGGMGINRAFAMPGAFPSAAKRGALFSAALEACDTLDGLADGIISDVGGCKATFTPETAMIKGVPLRCPDGTDSGDTCLSDVQIAALRRMNNPVQFSFMLASGTTGFPGFNTFTSDTGIPKASPLQPTVSVLGIGLLPPGFPARPGMSLSATFGDNYIRYGIVKDPSFNPLSLDPSSPGAFAARFSELSALDTPDQDLTSFARRGGKLLLLHGTEDLIVSPRISEQYYRDLQLRMGSDLVDRFMRFYLVPGFAHAISTNFNLGWDYLGALDDWTLSGVDPGTGQIVVDTAGIPGRTRPLCRYPTLPRYRGAGDVNDSKSFSCSA